MPSFPGTHLHTLKSLTSNNTVFLYVGYSLCARVCLLQEVDPPTLLTNLGQGAVTMTTLGVL